MISLINISKIYTRKQSSEDVIALDNVSLTLPESGFVSILGASGSGKTTLLNLLGGLDHPTSGEMIVDQISTSSFKEKDWDAYRNEKIGFVLQNCYLLPHLSVKENVAVKLQISEHKDLDINKLVDEALEQVDLLDKKNDKPKALSGGQKQRVAIARAIVGKPVVILADEPTGALDSKTGSQIMDLLKKLSKEHLVVMVTHNQDYADKYSDRIIRLQDGKIISDTVPTKVDTTKENKSLGKVAFPFFTSLKWGLRNLIIKKFSTISVVLASALGLAGVGLILSMSSSVNDCFIEAERRALSQYPITFNSYSKQSMEGSEDKFIEFTDEQVIFADLSGYAKQEHFNYMSEEFLAYMDNMPASYYSARFDASITSFNLYTCVNAEADTYTQVSTTSSLFYKSIDRPLYIQEQYDCLTGSYPTNENELALVVDSYNRVSGSSLKSLGFDVDTSHYSQTKIAFTDIIGKEYRYVSNDDYYYYDETNEIFKRSSKNAKAFYTESTNKLVITGILREKPDSDNALFRNGIIYSTELEKKLVKNANESQIVIAQKSFGLEKNVLTGSPFVDTQSGSTKLSATYMYESAMFNLGSFERITTLYYFTDRFDSREDIKDYFKKYVPDETVDFSSLSITDYLEKASTQFDASMQLVTTVLYVFAGITVFVSAILNAILTYISIHQRTNEIGLLRSLGARKVDIGIMIETESLLSGLLGGLLSILLSLILIGPLNQLITYAVYQFNFYLLSKTTFTLSGLQPWVIPIILGIALLTSLLSALIPAIIASRKDPARAINE